MPNALAKALADLKHRIPKEILKEAFSLNMTSQYRSYSPVSVDHRIQQLVIEDRVIPDCNLTGGTEAFISLDGLRGETLRDGGTVYRIPMSLTNDRHIMEVFKLAWGYNTQVGMGQGYNPYGGSAMDQAMGGLMAANSAIVENETTDVTLVGENTIVSRSLIGTQPFMKLHCRLAADGQFSHLKPRAIRSFSELVTLAVKAYIYNNIAVPMDQAQLSGGMSLGRFTEIVESYADANELYEEFVSEKWEKIQFFNDPVARQRHLRLVGGRRY